MFFSYKEKLLELENKSEINFNEIVRVSESINDIKNSLANDIRNEFSVIKSILNDNRQAILLENEALKQEIKCCRDEIDVLKNKFHETLCEKSDRIISLEEVIIQNQNEIKEEIKNIFKFQEINKKEILVDLSESNNILNENIIKNGEFIKTLEKNIESKEEKIKLDQDELRNKIENLLESKEMYFEQRLQELLNNTVTLINDQNLSKIEILDKIFNDNNILKNMLIKNEEETKKLKEIIKIETSKSKEKQEKISLYIENIINEKEENNKEILSSILKNSFNLNEKITQNIDFLDRLKTDLLSLDESISNSFNEIHFVLKDNKNLKEIKNTISKNNTNMGNILKNLDTVEKSLNSKIKSDEAIKKDINLISKKLDNYNVEFEKLDETIRLLLINNILKKVPV